jgi:hypothetical protein
MSNLTVNPWEVAESLNEAVIPSFVKGKYMLLRIAPPKGKTVRDGLVNTLALMSYTSTNGSDVKMIEVSEGPGGYEVSFPFGKRGIQATKYRGPKSWYKFKKEDGSWFQIGSNNPETGINNKFTPEYAEKHLSASNEEWADLSEADRDGLIDQYLYDMYLFAFALDYNLKVEQDTPELPFVGMVTDLYRRYTPPAKGQKYGNTIVTKFAPSQGRDTLDGEFDTVDEAIAVAIYDKLQERDAARFDPTDFKENERDEFDLAA